MSGMKPAQCKRAVKACFHLSGVPTSTSLDGAVTGGGKKPHQKKCCHNECTSTLKQGDSKRIHFSDAELDSDT